MNIFLYPHLLPGTHLHQPRSAGAFTPGWPNASAADLKLRHAPTLQLGESRESLDGLCGSRENLDGYLTPVPSQKTVETVEPTLNDNQVTPYYERSCPEAVFTIRYSSAWEEVLNAFVDNIQGKSHDLGEFYVEDNFGNRYNFQDGGRLNKPPSADLFPIRVLRMENTPDVPSGPPTAATSEEAPSESPEHEVELPPPIPKTTETPCPKPKLGEHGEQGGKAEKDQVQPASVKHREMRPQPTPPSQNAYTDGSYWKKLASVFSCFF